MKQPMSARRPIFQYAFRAIARVSTVVRRAGLVALVCLAALAAGVVGVARNALVREMLRMGVHRVAGFLQWWPTQSVHAQGTGGPTFTVFDAPGAGTGMFQGTMGTSINDSGDIAGVYLTAPSTTVPNLAHGFVRSAATGSITAFDAPNAGTGKNQGTFPASINTAGDVAGMYFDASNAYHGFVRSAAGAITEFDVLGAPTTIGHRGTLPISLNAGGDIAGFYVDINDVRHGFVRAASGAFTSFDATGAGTGPTQGTVPFNIDAVGDITGFYVAANGTFHGFLRASNGTITAPIDAPGAGTGPSGKLSFMGTLPLAFDSSGDIAGVYADASSVNHGFVRSAAGTFTTFDVPGAGTTGLFTETVPASMNARGDISGIYTDTSGVHHGFVRAANGTFTAPLDAPNAATTGMFSATVLIKINATDQITGTFEDTSGVFHGFLLTLGAPPPPPAATPTFSPPAGTYTSAQMVTISDTTAGATIYYTTDGSTPTTSSTKFTTPISVSTTETISAIAAASGFSNSSVASATYTINTPPPAATPTFSPAPGNYTSQQMVTISDTTAGATIYFTTDGSTPTTSSTKFTSPIPVSSPETIKAIALATGFSNSAVGSATYTFNPDFQVSVNPTTLNIARGQSGTATFTVAPQNGFNSAVSFSCSGLPAEAACSFNPNSVTPNGAAVSSTLTVTTNAKSAALRAPKLSSERPTFAVLFPVLAILGFAALGRRGPRGLQLLGLLIFLMLASGLTSCGGGNTAGGNPGTPLGTSTVTVSASTSGAGAINHTATLTITVTQ